LKFLIELYTPEQQKKSTTPEDFVVNPWGKVPDINKDGALTTTEAIRMSKIINELTMAFSKDNQILYGFFVESAELDGLDLKLTIGGGSAIVDKTFVNTPIAMKAVWKNFCNELPLNYQGNILITLEFEYSLDVPNLPSAPPITNPKHLSKTPMGAGTPYDRMRDGRPVYQKHRQQPEIQYDKNQIGFNPFKIHGYLYDPETKQFVGSGWNKDQDVIILTGNINWKRHGDGTVELKLDGGAARDDIVIHFSDGTVITYDQQGGGSKDRASKVDGGIILANTIVAKATGINILYDGYISDDSLQFKISNRSTDSEIYVFYNGIYYSEGVDYLYNAYTKMLTFSTAFLKKSKYLFIYENILPSARGYMKKIYENKTMTSSKVINIPGLDPTKNYLIFYNGLCIHKLLDYTITTNTLTLGTGVTIVLGAVLSVTELIPGVSLEKNINLITDSLITLSVQNQSVGVEIYKKYLVFYNGIYYANVYDYALSSGLISFNNFIPQIGKSLKIIQI